MFSFRLTPEEAADSLRQAVEWHRRAQAYVAEHRENLTGLARALMALGADSPADTDACWGEARAIYVQLLEQRSAEDTGLLMAVIELDMRTLLRAHPEPAAVPAADVAEVEALMERAAGGPLCAAGGRAGWSCLRQLTVFPGAVRRLVAEGGLVDALAAVVRSDEFREDKQVAYEAVWTVSNVVCVDEAAQAIAAQSDDAILLAVVNALASPVAAVQSVAAGAVGNLWGQPCLRAALAPRLETLVARLVAGLLGDVNAVVRNMRDAALFLLLEDSPETAALLTAAAAEPLMRRLDSPALEQNLAGTLSQLLMDLCHSEAAGPVVVGQALELQARVPLGAARALLAASRGNGFRHLFCGEASAALAELAGGASADAALCVAATLQQLCGLEGLLPHMQRALPLWTPVLAALLARGEPEVVEVAVAVREALGLSTCAACGCALSAAADLRVRCAQCGEDVCGTCAALGLHDPSHAGATQRIPPGGGGSWLCDACGEPISSLDVRYTCAQCPDMDLCSVCDAATPGDHAADHALTEVVPDVCAACGGPCGADFFACADCPSARVLICRRCFAREAPTPGHDATAHRVRVCGEMRCLCDGCGVELVDWRRCLDCADVDLCSGCFSGGVVEGCVGHRMARVSLS